VFIFKMKIPSSNPYSRNVIMVICVEYSVHITFELFLIFYNDKLVDEVWN
jgi:hypothetical protein